MLIVVSDTGFRTGETDIINTLFDEGLEIFHLRKPSAATSAIKQLLAKIKEEYMHKIALHSHHQLANYFWLKHLHYTEKHRKSSSETEWQALKDSGYRLSTSIHKLEEVGKLSDCFDYAFFGPVFDSISKKGYKASGLEHVTISKQHPKLIAIGGLDEGNCRKALQMGFDGVALLGAVWKSDDPVKRFQQIKTACNSIDPLS